MIKYIIIVTLLILSLYSSSVNYESEKAEISSAFFAYTIQKDSTNYEKYEVAKYLYKKDEYYKSLEKALFIVDNTEDLELRFNTNKLIADIYESINDHKKAIIYSKRLLVLIKEIKKRSDLNKYREYNENVLKTEVLLRIGESFLLVPSVDSAKFYFEKVLQIKDFSRQVRINQGKVYSNLSGIYFYNDKYKNLYKAENYAKKAIKIHEKLNINQSLSADYGNLASIYMEKSNPKKAKELYFKALDYIKDDNRLKAVKYKEILYDNLGWAMYNLKDYISYDYLDKSISIRDSLRDVSKADIIKELEIKHSNDDKILAIQTQKQLAQRNTWLVGGIGAGAILLLLYFMNFYKLRQQKFKNTLYQNELIQQKNIEKLKTESQIKILNATLDGKESERKEIAETLHDNISALLSSAKLHLQASKKQFNGTIPLEIEKTQQIITQASQHIRDLSHSLVSSILLKFGLHYAIKDAAKKYSNSEITFHTQLEGIKRYDEKFEMKVYNIIQEFINNILKHSKADIALIRVKEKDNNIMLSIKDNGIGFNAEESINSGGIGLNQINARVKMMKGTFTIDSEENQGTKIKITVPIVEKETLTSFS